MLLNFNENGTLFHCVPWPLGLNILKYTIAILVMNYEEVVFIVFTK